MQDPIRVGTTRSDDPSLVDDTGVVTLAQYTVLDERSQLSILKFPAGSQILDIYVDVLVPFSGEIYIYTVVNNTPYYFNSQSPLDASVLGRLAIKYYPQDLALMSSLPPDVTNGTTGTIYTWSPSSINGCAIVTFTYVQKYIKSLVPTAPDKLSPVILAGQAATLLPQISGAIPPGDGSVPGVTTAPTTTSPPTTTTTAPPTTTTTAPPTSTTTPPPTTTSTPAPTTTAPSQIDSSGATGQSQTTQPHSPVPTRLALKQPFASSSIWNMPVGSGAQYVAANLQTTWSSATYGSDGTYAPMPDAEQEHTILTPSAPVQQVKYSSGGWGGDRCALTSTVLFSAPIPDSYVVPSSNDNGCSLILDADGRTVKQSQPFARCTSAGPVSAYVAFPDEDLYGPGITGSHGGSGLSAFGGTIRLGELRPTDSIGPQHALKVVVHAKTALYKAGTKADAYRWPATTADSYAVGWYGVDSNNNNTAMKMGSLLAIPAGTSINSLGLETVPAKLLAWTLQNYGAYIVDDTYGPAFAIAVERGPDGKFIDQFQSDYGFAFNQRIPDDTPWTRDIARLMQALYCINNNAPDNIGGGGTPLQPLAPEVYPPGYVPPTTTPAPTTTASSTSAPTLRPYGQDPALYPFMTFRDEFSGSSLSNVWNDHLWYDSSDSTINYSVENDELLIWPQQNSNGLFVERCFTTDNNFYQKYGYFEVEAMLPIGYGLRPIIWMMNHISNDRPMITMMQAFCGAQNNGYTGWSNTNNHPINFNCGVNGFDGTDLGHILTTSNIDLSAAYHKYGCRWDNTGITFFFDGVQVGSKVSTSAMTEQMFLMLDLNIGSLAGDPNAGGSTPPQGKSNPFRISYVRAWSLNDGTTTYTGSSPIPV